MAPRHVGIGHPLRRGVAEVTKAIDHLLGRAAADAELQAAAGDEIGGACILRHVQRVLVTHVDDRRADLDPLRYRRGIRAVGVDAVAEAAETNKLTLYRHFSSKDELVAEYLQRLAEKAKASWDRLAADYPGEPSAQLRAGLRTWPPTWPARTSVAAHGECRRRAP